LGGVNTVEELAVVKRVVVESATETIVLNADDIHCLRMADFSHAENICYVTMNSEHALVKQHIRAGGRAVALEKAMNGDMITIYDNGTHMPVLWSHLIPATLEGKAMHHVHNAMFAAGMAFRCGVDLAHSRRGLRTFDTSFFQAPGRTNVFDEHAFKVILDYAHNPAAFTAMVDLVDRMDVAGKRTVVVSAPGDRRDEDVLEAAKIFAGHFDRYILKADDNRRKRGHDEIPQLIKQGLMQNGVTEDLITIIPSEVEAVEHGLSTSEEGDLLMVFGDDSVRCWKQIIYFQDENSPEPAAATQTDEVEVLGMEDIVGDGDTLISDERGVRLARNTSEDSD
jgi:cyanophycin synthetase